MCTVTWMRRPEGYLLLCNRDERKSRQPALSPRINEIHGIKYIAPADGDYGGSWIGVNEHGLTLCLLNRYGDAEVNESRDYTSRGLLLIGLLDCSSVPQVAARVNDLELNHFRPFDLLAITRAIDSVLLTWTGSKYIVNSNPEDLVPLTSTSLKEPNIAIERRRQFKVLSATAGFDGDTLDRFHRSHLPTRGAYSVCMHREGATTVSLSKVTVGNKGLVFEYESGPPCENRQGSSIHLSIRQPR